MADGFSHEYEGTSSEDEVTAAPTARKERTPRQKAATQKALAALAERRAAAAAAKEDKKAKKEPASKAKAAPKEAPAAAGAGASSAPAPPPPPPAANPYAHSTTDRPSFDPMMLAEIVKREIEVQRLREKELGWKSRSSRRKARAAELDSSTDESSDSDRPSRVLSKKRSSRKPAEILPAADERDVDFFEKLMTRGSKFNPW